MDALALTTSASVSLSRMAQSQRGMSDRLSPQSLDIETEYEYGDDGEFEQDGVLLLVANLAPNEVRVYNINGGNEDNPLGEDTNLGTLKEFLLIGQSENPDGTDCPSDGVTVAFNAAMATALGLSGAVSFTAYPGSKLQQGYPTGRNSASGSTITLTNLSTDEQTTVVIFLGGFKEVPTATSGSPMGLLLALTYA